MFRGPAGTAGLWSPGCRRLVWGAGDARSVDALQWSTDPENGPTGPTFKSAVLRSIYMDGAPGRGCRVQSRPVVPNKPVGSMYGGATPMSVRAAPGHSQHAHNRGMERVAASEGGASPRRDLSRRKPRACGCTMRRNGREWPSWRRTIQQSPRAPRPPPQASRLSRCRGRSRACSSLPTSTGATPRRQLCDGINVLLARWDPRRGTVLHDAPLVADRRGAHQTEVDLSGVVQRGLFEHLRQAYVTGELDSVRDQEQQPLGDAFVLNVVGERA